MRGQKTIKRITVCRGVGLHTGTPAALRFVPAPTDTGIVFVRRVRGREVRIPARATHVVSTRFCTVLGGDGETVQTVEHLMAALVSLGIDNLYVEVEGPEIPILDGSAWPFIQLLRQAGIRTQAKPQPCLEVQEPVLIREGDRWIHVAPFDRLSVTYTMQFDHPFLGLQVYSFEEADGEFDREVARARTFGFLKDLESLRSAGLIKGGSLENALVIGEQEVVNEEGFRYPDELVRHKVLDLIGDLALLGLPLLGKITAHQAGHSLHVQMASALLERQAAWSCRNQIRQHAAGNAASLLPTRLALESGIS